MNKLDKTLSHLSPKEKAHIKIILQKLIVKDLAGLDIKKLKGNDDIFRVRKGDIRIIYRIHNDQTFILAIERRSEKTYRTY